MLGGAGIVERNSADGHDVDIVVVVVVVGPRLKGAVEDLSTDWLSQRRLRSRISKNPVRTNKKFHKAQPSRMTNLWTKREKLQLLMSSADDAGRRSPHS